MRLLALPGVYRPLLDSHMLADALRDAGLPGHRRLLDLGTGSGVVAISGARLGARATAVDVSRRAVLTATLNARLNGVRVRALCGSLFTPVANERFDCIASNPPYVPATSPTPPTKGRARAWDAGPDGRILLDRICAQAPNHLSPGGTLMLVHTAWVDEHRTLDLLRAAGLDAKTVDRRREPFGPVMRERLRAGLLPPHARVDELVVIRATKVPVATQPRSSERFGRQVSPGV